MRIVTWNIRGLGSEIKIASVKRLIRQPRATACFLQETKLEVVSVEFVRRIWENDNYDFRFSATVGPSAGAVTVWIKTVFK